jgi:hypothetical protein
MSRLVARILFCMFMFPIGVVVYCSTVLTLERVNWGYQYGWDSLQFDVAGIMAFAFVSLYWFLLWRKSVRWTIGRILVPVIGGIIAILIEFSAQFIEFSDRDGHLVLLAILIRALWLAATVYFWRETPAERARRIGESGRGNVACPTCGYNLTGLNEARCPECGAKFTLDELFASQNVQTIAEVD